MKPVGVGDVKVTFEPTRLRELPDIYKMKGVHPKFAGPGHVYYYIQDSSTAGMNRVFDLEHHVLKVPYGNEAHAKAKGFLKLQPGEICFSRLDISPPDGTEDVPVLFANGKDIFRPEVRSQILELRDRSILGPRHLRSNKKPDYSGTCPTGGTAFERTDPPPKSVRGGRCYSYGKAKDNNASTLQTRKDLLRLTMDMAMTALRTGPPEVVENLDICAQLFNMPAIGMEDNTAFGAAQLNLAGANSFDSTDTLENSMGDAGILHVDDRDSPAHFTHMLSLLDLPKSFDPGRFFILYPGLYVTTEEFSSVCFSGLRRHVGTPPIAPKDATKRELQEAARMALLSYAPMSMSHRKQRWPLAALANQNTLYNPPEAIAPELANHQWDCTHATFPEDGLVPMTRSVLMSFICRALLGLVVLVLGQIDSSVKAKVDSDAFLGSFSFTTEDGAERRVGPWAMGSGWRSPGSQSVPNLEVNRNLTSQRDIMKQQFDKWASYCDLYSRHLPYVMSAISLPRRDPRQVDDLERDYKKNPAPPTSRTRKRNQKTQGKQSQKPRHRASSDSEDESSETSDDSDYNPKCKPSPKRQQKPKPKSSTDNDNSQDSEDLDPNVASDAASNEQDNAYHPSDAGVSEAGTAPAGPPSSWSNAASAISNANGDSIAVSRGTRSRANTKLTDPHPPPAKKQKTAPTVADMDANRAREPDTPPLLWRGDGYQKLVGSFPGPPQEKRSQYNLRKRTRPMEVAFEMASGAKDDPMVIDDDEDSGDNWDEMNVLEAEGHNTYAELPSYLKPITATAIYSELVEVENAVIELTSCGCDISMSDSASMVSAFQDAVTLRPLDANSVPAIRAGWIGLHALQSNVTGHSLMLRKQRSVIMTSAYAAWHWLHGYIPRVVKQILDLKDRSVPWLSSLINAVGHSMGDQLVRAVFNAKDHGINMPDATCVMDFSADISGISGQASKHLIDNIVTILGTWIGYPQDMYWWMYFVHSILRDIGQDILVLDATWNMYQRVSKGSFRGTGPVSFDLAEDYSHRSNHPLYDPMSEQWRRLATLSSFVNNRIDGRLACRSAVQPLVALPVDTAPPEVSSVLDRRIDALTKFVEDCHAVVFKSAHINNLELYEALMTKPDYFCPFREHAPTRIHVRGSDGPFAPSVVRTLEGVFSALVDRSITFGTEFSRNCRTFFTSADDFREACRSTGETAPRYFCDPGAYGRYNPKKKTDLVDEYWRELQENRWPGLDVLVGERIPFMVCFRFFRPVDGPHFKQLGELCAFLLTVDYVYAGVVEPPSIDDIGQIIQIVNKGAVRGLELTGLLPTCFETVSGSKTKPKVSACTEGLRRAYNVTKKYVEDDFVVDAALEQSVTHSVGMDYAVVENALCKFSRAVKRGYVTIS
ncbi:hypothetical protein BDZ97DRAFT_1925083 [Flammula alnicola]|nr:hypothetical protein BDZ97DRAFT_1925083 [Flammula alnicola]